MKQSELESLLDDAEPIDPETGGRSSICIQINCPKCGDGMHVNTVVGQAMADKSGRTRYEAICADCQVGLIITAVKTVGSYNDLFGFDAANSDWE